MFGNFDPPPQVIKAVSDNLATSCYGYVSAHGLVSTREAIAKYYNTRSSPLTSSVSVSGIHHVLSVVVQTGYNY